jgi:predicted acyltransferase
VLAGRCLSSDCRIEERLGQLLTAGGALTVAGLLWSVVLPINKNLWSSSYVLFTAGLACLLLAAIIWLIDVRHVENWTQPFLVFGVNPIFAYVGAELCAVLLDSTVKVRIDGRLQSAHVLFYQRGLAAWLAPGAASLMYALCFVALWYVPLFALYRRGVRIKI